MAPRTYIRKQLPNCIPKSAMAINALLAANMVQNCHSKGQHISDSSSLMESDCSLHLNKTDDTFTRLARGQNFNDVFFSADRAPYESMALSQSTVDIKLLMLGDSSTSRLKNGCNSINDGCISKSLMLIKSWEEQKPDFITQRRKTKRKAVHSFVRARPFAKRMPWPSSHPARMSASLNVTKPQNGTIEKKTNTSGPRLSKRIVKRYFKGFSAEDLMGSLNESSRKSVGISFVEKGPEREIVKHVGFDKSSNHLTMSLQHRHDASVRITRSQSLLQASLAQDNSSIQNESQSMLLPSVNNSICDNSILPAKYTSTPFRTNKKTQQFVSHSRLGDVTAANSPKQTRARKKLAINLPNKTDNNSNSIITKDISVESPILGRKTNRRHFISTDDESTSKSRKSRRSKSITKFPIYDDTSEQSPIAMRTRSRSRSCTGKYMSRSTIDFSSNIKTDNDVSTKTKRNKSEGFNPVALGTRSQSRSRNETDFVALDMSGKRRSTKLEQKFDPSLELSSKLTKKSSTRRSLKGISAIKEELNKENIDVSNPFKRVTRRRKTVTQGKSRQSEDEDPNDSKAATKKAIPACSIKNIFCMTPMVTRLQRKKLLESSINNNNSDINNSNLSPEKNHELAKENQTPILVNNAVTINSTIDDNVNSSNAITINSTIDDNVFISSSIIKPEPLEELCFNYSIEEASSPRIPDNSSSPIIQFLAPFRSSVVAVDSVIDEGECEVVRDPPALIVDSAIDEDDYEVVENPPALIVDSAIDEDDCEVVENPPALIVDSVIDEGDCEVVRNSPAPIVDVIDDDDDVIDVDADLLPERLYINDVKQEHIFAVPTLPATWKSYAPGKGYRRSILARREVINIDEWPNVLNTSCLSEQRRSSVRLVPVSLHQNLSGTEAHKVQRDISEDNRQYQKRCSVELQLSERQVDQSSHHLDDTVDEEVAGRTAREIVLRNCGQQKAEPWDSFYPNRVLKNCSKIGEGVYGEVFMFRNAAKAVSVMKVIPIEGDQLVNGERQKKFQDILSEIIIAKKLSSLSTSGFNRLEAVHLVHGAYPARLLDLWRLYDETNGSENDCPDTFQTEGQLYLVLQLQNGGKDLESYEFKNPIEAYSIFEQLSHSLAQAEHYFSFEHRDLHWGNVLISVCDPDLTLTYTLPSTQTTYTVKTHGVQCNIIDFTLSRMTVAGGEAIIATEDRRSRSSSARIDGEDWVLYNDLRNDPELFDGVGDVQFDVYRQMKDETGDDWAQFCPRTNVHWLNYILQKMLTEIEYSEPETRTHKSYLNKMRRCRSRMQMYANCTDVVMLLP